MYYIENNQITKTEVSPSHPLPVTIAGNSGNPTNDFSIAKVDVTGATYNYYAYLDINGNWYIMRETISTTLPIYMYYYSSSIVPFNGASGWSNRASITYVEFNSAF